MDRTYIAQRDRLRVGTGFIHTGEAYPAGEVTAQLVGLEWVGEGTGPLPGDAGTHAAFSADELAALGARPAKPAPAPAMPAAKRRPKADED